MSLLFLVTGPSGSGKTTLCESMIAKHDKSLTRVITATSRPPRKGEINGKDYYFFSKEDFSKKINDGDFYEHATVYNNYYGSLKSEIQNKLNKGQNLILSIDIQGIKNFKKTAESDPFLKNRLACIYIHVKDIHELRNRLQSRGKDPESIIQSRLDIAQQEDKEKNCCDYIIESKSKNDDLEAINSIYKAENLKVR